MKDFFDQFKENLENREEPPFEKRLWQGLEKNLSQQNKKNRFGAAWWWALGALLILLLGSNLYSFFQMRNVKQQISTFEQKTDTVYLTDVQTKVIYKTDTIYQTKTIRNDVVRYVASPGSNFIFSSNSFASSTHQKTGSSIFDNSLSENKQYIPKNSLLNYIQKEIISNYLNKDLTSAHLSERIAFSTLSDCPRLEFPLFEDQKFRALMSTLNEARANKKLTFQQHLYMMRPKNFQLGVSGGWANVFNEDLSKNRGYSTSINTAIEFSSNLQLWAAASLFKTTIESDEFNATIKSPMEDPPAGFEFKIAEADLNFTQYSVGLQYFFNANKKWKPFIGLGYASEVVRPYDINYDYENDSQNLEWSTKELFNNLSNKSYVLFRVGLEYQISNHWNWQFKTDFRKDFDDQDLLIPALLNVQGGLNYRF